MLNIYEDIKNSTNYNKFEIGEILFAEYKCPLEEKHVGIWTKTDYLVHVVSGKKTWHTTNGSWSAETGQTLYFKKGAAIVEQHFDEEFCLLLFFIPDEFIRAVVREYCAALENVSYNFDSKEFTVRINNDVGINAFFQSMISYFSGIEKPSEHLLRLKLKELILSILVSRNNPALSAYFFSLLNNKSPLLKEIMEENFRFNLRLKDFADLCHRSLSSFKRDFFQYFKESPGKWLLTKRLDYSAVLLRNHSMSISQIVFESGFENLSHFSKAFKEKFGMSPTTFRNKASLSI